MTRIEMILVAFVLDLIIGDPYSFPHPVKLMGKIIRKEEQYAREKCKTKEELKRAGFFIVLLNIFLGLFFPMFILSLFRFNPIIRNILEIYMMYTCLAAKSLAFEANMVKKELNESLERGRKRVAYIVGRQTDQLSKEEVIKATVETVAENTSDGIIAPLFFIAILGAPGGMVYKFVNTMDSTLGYMDDKYIDIGHYPAINDDYFNYIPARITAFLMIISSVFKYDYKNGYRILKRDNRKHKSPNAGFPESAVAGLLNIQLGGNNTYNGILIEKPTIGDKIEDIDLSKIDDTIKIMYRSEILFLIILTILMYY